MKYDFFVSSNREGTNAEKYVLREKLFGRSDLIPMWVADMDIDTPPFIIEALKKRLEHPNFGYEEAPSSMYKAQIKWMKKHHGISFEEKDMLYSHSVVASINAAIEAFSGEGDKIIVQTPVYPPFFKSVVRHNRKVLFNPLKREEDGMYVFDLDDLLSKIDKDTKLLLLCSPHNPVGRVWKREELEKIAQICLKHNIVVFSDEIHSDLVYAPNKHIPFASLGEDVRNITLTALGAGKSFNLAGFAISTVAISNENLREKFKKVYDNIHFAQGTILGHTATQSAYSEGEEWLGELKTHLMKNISLLSDICKKYNDKISFIVPEGTYLAWLDCSKMGFSDKELRDFFVNKAGLGLSSGISFSKEGSGFMRLNFAVSAQIMKKAMKQLDEALGEVL
ncbi:PatB family C-S lyase [Sulfurimonas sp. HSL-1716]|uniref:PatB family C-S lyase n=1 Tax=Hydrocurvibacter sulfurireducens TaxID=3131937 RepID=UPI0031F7594C